jgi:hypothetical protein
MGTNKDKKGLKMKLQLRVDDQFNDQLTFLTERSYRTKSQELRYLVNKEYNRINKEVKE